jgi:hypothetical protein
MQFRCKHCGEMVRMLADGSIGCPNGHADPMPSMADRERRMARGWRWLKRRLGLDGSSERRSLPL